MKKDNNIWKVLILGAIALLTSLPLIFPYCIDNPNIQLFLEKIMYADLMDGFLMIPRLLYRVLGSVESAYKIYILFINFVSAFVVFWSFEKIFKTTEIALLGSMLYNFAPYRLNSLYIMGDLGESFALTFIPLVFALLYLMVKGDEEGFGSIKITILLILAYSCALQNDVLTFLILCGTSILLLIIFWKKIYRKEILFIILQVAIGTLILNFYLISSIGKVLIQNGESAYFDFSFIQERGVYLLHYIIPYFKYGTHNSFSGTGLTDTQPLGIGFAITVCVFAYFWIVFLGESKDKNNRLMRWGNSLALIGVINLLLSTNSFPWDRLYGISPRIISVIYSPARFIPVVLTCFVIISCIVMQKMKEENNKWYRPAMIMVASLGLMLTIYLIGDIMTVGEIYTPGLYENTYDISPLDYLKYMI